MPALLSSLSVEDRQPSNYEEVPDHAELGKGFVRTMYDGEGGEFGIDHQRGADDDNDDDPSSSRSYDDSDGQLDGDRGKTTAAQSFLHLVKGYIGPGCLSLPWAFSRMGVVPATVACFVLGYWSSYNCWSIVRLKRQINSWEASPSSSVGAVASAADSGALGLTQGATAATWAGVFRAREEEPHHGDPRSSSTATTAATTYPDVAGALAGDRVMAFTKYCICVQQLSICTVFLSFVGTNLNAVLTSVVGWDVSHATVLTLALPAVVMLSCLPNLKALAPITALGTALLFLGFAFLAGVVAIEWPNRNHTNDGGTNNDPSDFTGSVHDWKDVPLALCALLYSFEGICLILPVESSMRRPDQFFPVFAAAMASSATVFSVLAGMSVAAFGNVTNGSITAFLLAKYATGPSPVVRSLVLAANAAVSLSVLVTYPLQLFPCLELLLPSPESSSNFLSVPSALDERQAREDDSSVRIDSTVAGNDSRATGSPGSPAPTHRRLRSSALEIRPTSFLSEEGEDADDSTNASYRDSAWREPQRRRMGGDPYGMPGITGRAVRLRLGLVLLTYVVAVAVPNVQSLISLAGALAGSSTALLIPPALELVALQRLRRRLEPTSGDLDASATIRSHPWAVHKCYVLLMGGFIFMLIGTVASFADILRDYTSRL